MYATTYADAVDEVRRGGTAEKEFMRVLGEHSRYSFAFCSARVTVALAARHSCQKLESGTSASKLDRGQPVHLAILQSVKVSAHASLPASRSV